jgi:hypothetical protein
MHIESLEYFQEIAADTEIGRFTGGKTFHPQQPRS